MSQVYFKVAKLVGTGATGTSQQGYSVKLSDDGNYLFVGGVEDDGGVGTVWFYQKVTGVWTQKQKIVPSGYAASTSLSFGRSLTVNPSVNALLVGGHKDNGNVGASFVFTLNGASWTEQAKLVGLGNDGASQQGCAVGLSADANTAIVGGSGDASGVGAAWIFVRNETTWSQQGEKLVGNDSTGVSSQGYSVAITSNGNLVIVGGRGDSTNVGAIWLYLRSAGAWSQVGTKIKANDITGKGYFGASLAFSGDDQWLIIGGSGGSTNAAWTFKRNGTTYKQFGNKLLAVGSTSSYNYFGMSVATNKIGSVVAVGGYGDYSSKGAVWVYAFNGTNFNHLNNKIVASDAINSAYQGRSVSFDSSGSQLLFGGYMDDGAIGAAWIYSNIIPTTAPSSIPTFEPTIEPTMPPSALPSFQPSVLPTVEPTTQPTVEPTTQPSVLPTTKPSALPTIEPTTQPSAPTFEPTYLPTVEPTTQPSALPTVEPTNLPTVTPTVEPTWTPTQHPTVFPTITPTWSPTALPTTALPSTEPSISPSFAPIQVTSNKLSSAGIAGIAVGAFVFFGSVIWIVAMQMKHFDKPPQQEKSSVPDQLESGNSVELEI